MKNFDIEQLERKNIYKTPENFFAGMQENVLKQTVHKTQITEIPKPAAKIIPMKTNWIYAAAAALALLLGFGFFIKNMNSAPANNTAIAENTQKQMPVVNENNANNEVVSQILAAETVKPQQSLTNDLTFEENTNQNVRKQAEVPVATTIRAMADVAPARKAPAAKTGKVNNRESIDQILTSFTSAELAEMSKDAEMDVYLDLYN